MSYLGITPPLSVSFPSNKELAMNELMENYLNSHMVCESSNGDSNRNTVINKLLSLVQSWVSTLGLAKGISKEDCENGGGSRLQIFGSQRLGVHYCESDIDVLCITPVYITRYDFFTTFCSVLSTQSEVSMLLPLPEAYTPVVKFNFLDQAIDMVFVNVNLPRIPQNFDILNDKYLIGLDDQGIRSLNGPRVAEVLLQCVPSVPVFCVALRAIKHWARQRGIYSNVLGFLGGVNFAILVAFVCQRFVNACPATIVHKFFLVYSQWQWPSPIMLRLIEEPSIQLDGAFLPSWNPKIYAADRAHLMPIITPTYPPMNSSYNVGIPQFRTIQVCLGTLTVVISC
jgi:poly(A) polymerase